MALQHEYVKVIFICDGCDTTEEGDDFYVTLEDLKARGWIVRRSADKKDWVHICAECVRVGMG